MYSTTTFSRPTSVQNCKALKDEIPLDIVTIISTNVAKFLGRPHTILTSGQDPKKNRPFVLDHAFGTRSIVSNYSSNFQCTHFIIFIVLLETKENERNLPLHFAEHRLLDPLQPLCHLDAVPCYKVTQ